jgi:hypothetical protein
VLLGALLLGLLARTTAADGTARPAPGTTDVGGLSRRVTDLEQQITQLQEGLQRSAPPSPSLTVPAARPAAQARQARPARPGPEDDRLLHRSSLLREHKAVEPDARARWVVDRLWSRDPDGSRTAHAVRAAFDDVIDGPRTGRYRVAELHKQEKILLGLLMERALVDVFGLRRSERDGDPDLLLDDGTALDLRFSRLFGGWTFSTRQVGKPVLLLHADDETNRWSLGVLLLREEMLARGGNRDGARRLAAEHRDDILWVHRDASLPANALLALPPEEVQQILGTSSDQRIAELLRRAQGLVISHNNLATVAMEQDVRRRVRMARHELAADGIIVLTGGNARHTELAHQLALPTPGKREYVSARLARVQPEHEHARRVWVLDDTGEKWTPALPGDVREPLPRSLRH